MPDSHAAETVEEMCARWDAERKREQHRALVEYVRWRDSLPDLSGMDESAAWRAFAKAHDGRCALCRFPSAERVIDHDHTTGLVRGLLCRSCNGRALSGIPHRALVSYDDISPALALYCQYPPTAAARLRVRYHGPFTTDPAP
ncbi:MAG TPA: endonuclease domain-containing protein, partial [Armatimonadota bacterium]|nr:endonuclease domain-containing protein [Armatimonadota bacterium]